jgi:hypothetical protein
MRRRLSAAQAAGAVIAVAAGIALACSVGMLIFEMAKALEYIH